LCRVARCASEARSSRASLLLCASPLCVRWNSLRAETSDREVEGDGRFGGQGMATLPHRFAQAPAPHKGE